MDQFKTCGRSYIALVVRLNCDVSERFGNLGDVLDKATAIASQTKKASDLLHRFRGFPFNNGFNLLRINSNAFGRNDMTKISYFRNPELTLGELGIEAMFTEFHEDETKMFLMFFLRFGVDKNVIQIYHNKLVEIFMEDGVHEM